MQFSKYIRIFKLDEGYALCNTLNSCIVKVDNDVIQNNIINGDKLDSSELDFLAKNGFFSDSIDIFPFKVKKNRDHTQCH